MDMGFIKTLTKDALQDDKIPSMEKVLEAYEKGGNADPYMIAYLKHRPELVSVLRMFIADELPPMLLLLASGKSGSEAIQKHITKTAHDDFCEIVKKIKGDSDEEKLIEDLASPETIIHDCARLAWAKMLFECTAQ